MNSEALQNNTATTEQVRQLFPELPRVPTGLTEPNGSYRRGVWVAVATLGGFLLLYLGLTAFFVGTAYVALVHIRHTFSPLFQILGAAISALIAVFLVKALFAVRKGGTLLGSEVTRESEPKLFAFLDELARVTGAPRAHRVFLSNQVNAAVFYDLSLKELLLPSKKNLEIGLPLVNALSLSELTAVLAHEFGHFSQSSMAIGQWVYVARQVAAQLIAARDWLDNGLTRLSRTNLRVAWIGWIVQLVIWSIRSLLNVAFRGVVLAERALSREMEFHADLVAVSITGSEPLIVALARLQATDDTWDEALGIAAKQAEEGRLVPDLFALQPQVLARMREVMANPAYGNPLHSVGQSRTAHRIFTRELAEPPRMWSTHPSNVAREENAKRVFIASRVDERSAWSLFENPDALRTAVTAEWLAALPKPSDSRLLSKAEAQAAVDSRFSAPLLNPRYRGLYLSRTLSHDVPEASQLWTPSGTHPTLDEPELYGPELAQLYAAFRAKLRERDALEAVYYGHAVAPGGVIQVAGQVVKRRELPELIDRLTREAGEVQRKISDTDAAHRQVHLRWAEGLGNGWREYLQSLLRLMHFAEHQLANLRDAFAHFANVLAIVTADDKISRKEGERLVKAGMEVQNALTQIYAYSSQVELPASVQETFHGKTWQEVLPAKYSLSAPTFDSMNEWLGQMNKWVELTSDVLTSVERRTLNTLLEAEERIRRARNDGSTLGQAPRPGRTPERYAAFGAANKRPRQYRLGIWDRFVLAQGFGPNLLRVVAAGCVLSSVVMMTEQIGQARVVVFNGLTEAVKVDVGRRTVTVQPGGSSTLGFAVDPDIVVSTKGHDGFSEQFRINAEKGAGHYIYNVGGAKALLREDAVYGLAEPRPPEYFGHKRWLELQADYYFEAAPAKVRFKGKGTTKRVLSALDAEEERLALDALAAVNGITDVSRAEEPTLLSN